MLVPQVASVGEEDEDEDDNAETGGSEDWTFAELVVVPLPFTHSASFFSFFSIDL